MDNNIPFFSLPFEDTDNGDILFTVKSEFHDSLPSASLLETDDVFEQFLSTVGPIEEPDLNGPTTLHCEICQKKFDNAKKYYGHLRVHSKDNLWTCHECPGLKFSTKQQMMKHSLTHKPLEKVWRCQQCPLAFEALWRLQQHLFAKHINYRPHQCNKCEKAFGKPSDLKKHQAVHNGIKEHNCSICKRQFNDKSNLARHMHSHGVEKPFPCPACGWRYKHLHSMRRHFKSCRRDLVNKAMNPVPQTSTTETSTTDASTRENHPSKKSEAESSSRDPYCRSCGLQFQSIGALFEHCSSMHVTSNEKKKEKKEKLQQSTFDTIVNELLSVEANYNSTANNQNSVNHQNDGNTADNLMHIEFSREMNQLHTLDDELFYNDIDFDSFQSNQFITNEDYGIQERNEVLFDFSDGRSMDQDLMNALNQVKGDHLPDELLNSIDENAEFSPQCNVTEVENQVSVNECATIFETDVDLEASTNLAMNLNQLIGENNVQYISTEDDDTFIISLDSGIDTEKLTDMLEIGIKFVDGNQVDGLTNKENEDKNNETTNIDHLTEQNANSIVLTIPENIFKTDKIENANANHMPDNETKPKAKVKLKKEVLFVCRTCNKVFRKKDNWRSHLATHNSALRRHKCTKCGERFSYRSSLNKHKLSAHTRKNKRHKCGQCGAEYIHSWMLKEHVERDHKKVTRHECKWEGCNKKFFKKHDYVVHQRYHTGERPYICDICGFGFPHVSHLKRHVKNVDCTKRIKVEKKEKTE